MKVTLAALFTVLSSTLVVHVAAVPEYGPWRGTTFWGLPLECNQGDALVGACGSGAKLDCRNGGGPELTHEIRCVDPVSQNLPWTTGDVKPKRIAEWGQWAKCGSQEVAVGRCSGGANKDCGDGVAHTLDCAEVSSTNIRLDTTDQRTICAKWGVDSMCPKGYVVTESCGAGEKGDCSTDHCSTMNDVFIGLRCTRARVYEYDSVGNYGADKSPDFSFDGVCKSQTFELEGSNSDRVISETFSFSQKSSLELFEESAVSIGSSLTKTLNVRREIGAKVGFPKLGLGAESKTSTGAGIEWTTTFDRSETYRNTLTDEEESFSEITWEYTLEGGRTWTLASWTAKVTAHGDYNVLFREYTPGSSSYSIVREDVLFSAGNLDERSYTLVLNSDNHSRDFLVASSCQDIAAQYMLGIGEFDDLTPETQFDAVVEDVVAKAPDESTSFDSGAPMTHWTTGVTTIPLWWWLLS